MSIQNILSRLDKVTGPHNGNYRAICPSHQTDRSRTGSLSIKLSDDAKVLLNCFAGCHSDEILSAIDLTPADLYEKPLTHNDRVMYQQKRTQADLDACELRLDMADDMRAQGIPLTREDLITERKAFIRKRELLMRGAA